MWIINLVFNFRFQRMKGKISGQPHTLIMYKLCDSNSVYVLSLCKKISLTFMHV